MICQKCGAQIADGNLFCTSCGAAVNVGGEEATVFAPQGVYPSAAPQQVAQPPEKKSAAPIIIAAVAVLVVVGVVLGVLFGFVLPNKEKDDDRNDKKRKNKETTTAAEIIDDGGYNDVLISEMQIQPMSKTISVGMYNVLAVKEDGTLAATGQNRDGMLDVDGWTDIVAVSSSQGHTLGLKTDGTVVATGNNDLGACDVSGWTDIISVSAGSGYSVGLKSDGTVVATGKNACGQCDVGGWTDIIAVSAGEYHTVGIKADGTVVAVGDNFSGACNISGWTNIIAVSLGYDHTIGLKSDGTVVAAGNVPNGIETWRNIVAVSTNDHYTIGLKSDGTVVSTIADDDKNATSDYTYLKNKLAQLRGVVAVSASGMVGYDIAALKSDGTVMLISMIFYWVENGIDEIDFEYDTSAWSGIKTIIPDRFKTPTGNGGNKLPEPVVDVTVPVTEPVTEPATEIVTEIITEPVTRPSTAAPTQRPTVPTTQAPTQRPTVPTTQAPTQRPIESTTQAPTQAPVQKPTELVSNSGHEDFDPRPDKEVAVVRFNEAINGVKPNAKKVVHIYSDHSIAGEIKVAAGIETAMKVLGGSTKFINDQLAKHSKGTWEYTGSDIKQKFPVEGEDYASKLTANDIERVTVSSADDGKTMVMYIYLKDDAKSSDVRHGQGHAPKAFNVAMPGVVDDNIPGAIKSMLGGQAEISYTDCQVIAFIDTQTGRVTKVQYDMNWTIYFGDNVVIPLHTSDLYTIVY